MIEFDASELIGTKNNPAGFDAVRAMARGAKAYHNLNPYPLYSPMTKDWKVEERGPLPRCLPFVRHIVQKGARWLFGKPVQFRAETDELTSELINEAWNANHMGRKSVGMASLGALAGGVALKWSYDEESDNPVRLHVLDASEHVRFYWQPGDTEHLLMARIQYPYHDARQNKWFWYREDITDDEMVFYHPIASTDIHSGSYDDPYSVADRADIYQQWQEKNRIHNPFGLINVWYMRNADSGGELGQGDLWPCYHIVDLINFTSDLEHKHNQKAIEPQKAYIDLTSEPDEAPGPDSAGAPETFRTVKDSPSQGKVEMMQPSAEMRTPVKEYADEMLAMVYEMVGSVKMRPEDITNKGNLTSAVLSQLYAPLIETTEEKRKTYGEDGLSKMFERMSIGLQNCKAKDWKAVEDVQVHWPEFFEKTDDEQMAGLQRRTFAVQAGFTTRERAVRDQASADGVIDTEKLWNEVQAESPRPAAVYGLDDAKDDDSNE